MTPRPQPQAKKRKTSAQTKKSYVAKILPMEAAENGNEEKVLYCSLDIETSDFNTENGELLEIGMVFFELEKNQIKITKEWGSAFKPAKEVPAKILALTGIRAEELADAPLFSDKMAEVQELLKDCVIVGHNINFDIGFLKSCGIKFNGRNIDTLDLAQIFLPTHTSYNLESLMNFLKVDHKDAHRALADARASLVVLRKLIEYYCTFPKIVRKKIQDLFTGDEYLDLHAVLECEFNPLEIELRNENVAIAADPSVKQALDYDRAILSFPLGIDHHAVIYGSLKKTKEKILLLCPSKKEAYALWKQGIAEAYSETEDLFDAVKFERFAAAAKTKDQKCFAAKIIVWQHINWQTRSVTDLNFSVSGNQFRPSICHSRKQKTKQQNYDKTKRVVAIESFVFVAARTTDKELHGRKAVILDMNKFEKILADAATDRVSWKELAYTFKQMFQSEENKKTVADILEQTDLFFGLAMLHFQKLHQEGGAVAVDAGVRESDVYQNISDAGLNYLEKLRNANVELDSSRIERAIDALQNFFAADTEHIRWVEMYGEQLTFHVGPRDLGAVAREKLGKFKKLIFTAALGSESLIRYFADRLALKDYPIIPAGQNELRKEFEVIISKTAYDSQGLLKLIEGLECPAAILLPNQHAVREFYEANFKELQSKFKVFAQSFSGGAAKIIENFTAQPQSLLIATDYFILKHHHNNLNVKTLILTRLPFEQFNHPFYTAQASKYQNQFLDFNIPRALNNFHNLISFFYGPQLERVYILDQKINKDYGKYFINYLESLPFVKLR